MPKAIIREEPLESDVYYKTVLRRITVLKDSDGNVRGALSTARDITERKRAEEEKEKLINELKDALANVKRLSRMLPICASCKKIRDDKRYWNRIETYISEHSGILFSHGLCPDCAKKAYEELDRIKEEEIKTSYSYASIRTL